MPWNAASYPASMKNLLPLVREKAIEIANALLTEGMDEGMAIRVAIAKAKEWERRQREA
jgi:uncharacterized protein YdaT